VRTLVVSDLHLGAPAGADVLRTDPALLEALVEGARGADRLVLLGDVLELRHGPARAAVRAAGPVLAAVGGALPRGAEVVLLAGNHDHRLAGPWLERRLDDGAAPLGLAERAPAGATPLGAALAAALGDRVTVHLDYPGTWLADDVWATHGHYLDRHATVPTFERLGVGALARLTRSPAAAARRPDDYERPLAPLYALLDALAERAPEEEAAPHAGASARLWRAMEGSGRRSVRRAALAGGVLAGVGLANLAGLGPVRADLSGPELRRSALRAMGAVVAALDVGARHVVFGHTHRAGPGPQDEPAEWSAPGGAGGVRLFNAGCWVRDPLWGAGDPASPYRPGGAVLLDGGAPRSVRLA
jgi:hypothetical protein